MGIVQHGYGNAAVQVDGSNNSVTVTCSEARLTLLQRHRRRRVPRKHLDLLDPYSRAIELVGRDDDLDALRAWLATDLPIAVRCLTGRAGSGKTRLAVELCEWAEGQGWLVGFATYDELAAFQQRQHLAGWRWPQPMLIVVDYAAASARVLRHWLEQLAEHQAGGAPRLRLLPLERHASAGLEDLLDPPLPVALPSLRTVEQRREVLGAVMAAASVLDGGLSLRPPVPGADPQFDVRLADDLIDNEPLYLMMAGLTAVQARVPHLLTIGRIDLAKRLASAEIERIGRVARDRGIDGQFLQHLAACVTLTDGVPRAAAESLALEEREALRLPALDAAAAAAALAVTLGGAAEGIEAIRPDLIGEAAILAVFANSGHSPDRQAAIIERCWRRLPAKTVATLVRAAQDFAPASGTHQTLDWLRHLAGLAQDPFELTRIIDEIPTATISMRKLAAEIQSGVVEFLDAETMDEAKRNLRALSLNNLANRLSALNQCEPALAAVEQATQLYRELAAARPNAFRPHLGSSLNNLASRLSDLGRREAALAAAEEAVAIRRELATAHPNAFRSDLAMSLANLAGLFSDLGRRERALAAAEEAVSIQRELAAARPDAFRPDLASSLNNFAVFLGELGRREAALSAAEEAAQLFRELAAAQPDAFLPDLAASLGNLAAFLSTVGAREAALAAAEEAAQLNRELATALPDAFRSNFAASLNTLANRLSDLGRREAALVAAEEAVAIRREQATGRPDAFRPKLAGSLSNLGNRLSALGRHEAALAAAGEAVAIRRELAAALPDAFRPDLAMSLNNLASFLSMCGRREAALAAAEEAVAIQRELAAAHPSAFRPNLAMTLNNLASLLGDLGRRGAALAAAEEAVAIRRELATA